MKIERKYILLILLGLYGFHLVLKFQHIPVAQWVSSYFADLLCIPILLLIASLLIAKTQQKQDFKLSFLMVLFTTIYVSVVFEFLLPIGYPLRFKSDWGDVVCYGIGALSFYLIDSFSSD